MKVRITHDTIRIRLNQTEVRSLGEGQSVQMRTPVTDGTSLCSILQPSLSEKIVVSLQPFSLAVDVPRPQLLAWATGDSITLESRQENGGDGLTVLIEKDFHCLHRDTADDVDTFPNPKLR
jgi:hypothetical protein